MLTGSPPPLPCAKNEQTPSPALWERGPSA